MRLSGVVRARVIDVRFAMSGKVARVLKVSGDRTGSGELIASLDRKIFQAELDRQLADYEKVRADFEIFSAKYSEPLGTIEKYLKTEKQAILNASVKEVETAKADLDLCDLFSPVDGIITDDSSIVPGVNITPASGAFKIIDSHSFYVEMEIDQKYIKDFSQSKPANINIDGFSPSQYEGTTLAPMGDGKKFFVKIPISGGNLLPGLLASVEV